MYPLVNQLRSIDCSLTRYFYTQLLVPDDIAAAVSLVESIKQTKGLRHSDLGEYKSEKITSIRTPTSRWFGVTFDRELIACVQILEGKYSDVSFRRVLLNQIGNSDHCELDNFVVHPEHRKRKYVALIMMRMAVDHALQKSNLLTIRAENQRLARFYKNMGMHRVDPVPGEGLKEELLYFDSSVIDRFKTPLYLMSDRYIWEYISSKDCG